MKHLLTIQILALSLSIFAGSWPQWRYDSGHTASCPENLETKSLKQLWQRSYPQRKMVWDDPLNWDLMPYDQTFEPVCSGDILIVNFNDLDKLVAFNTKTGKELWSFRCNGPIRFPAAIDKDRVFTVSDDGHLYCLDLKTGKMEWKFNGAPQNRLIVGNRRLISTWPARGGAVIADGKVWFSTGIWPFMGTFIYCINAKNGSEIWCNSGNHADYIKQPHDSPAFAGIAPQGILTFNNGLLTIPGGRSAAAGYDAKTGKQLYFHHAKNKKSGGSFVCSSGKYYYGHEREGYVSQYEIKNGKKRIKKIGRKPVLDGNMIYYSGSTVSAATSKKPLKKLWDISVDASGDLIKAGNTLIAGGKNIITFIDLENNGKKANISRSLSVKGNVKRLIAADNKLFAVTLEGDIIAFGANAQSPQSYQQDKKTLTCSAKAEKEVKKLLKKLPVKEGFATIFGIGNGDMVNAISLHSNLSLVVFDSSAKKIDAWRRAYEDAGFSGEKTAFIHWNPSMQTAQYYSLLTIINKLSTDSEFMEMAYRSLRPYGGIMIVNSLEKPSFFNTAKSYHGVEINGKMLVKSGAPSGAANYTHMYGSLKNTLVSEDDRVKLPLGLLWFGGNSNMDVLPRHGHGPPQQIVNGVLIIQGINSLSARDVYTGKILWKQNFKDLGGFNTWYDITYKHDPTATDYNQVHLPGANARGTNYVATSDAVYLVENNFCHVLDLKTGKSKKHIFIPAPKKKANAEKWGYIGCHNDFLIGTADFASDDHSSSHSLSVFNRRTGKLLWTRDATHSYIHNGIVASGNHLFVIDKVSTSGLNKLLRRGMPVPKGEALICFDLATGKIVWKNDKDIYGRWLGISEANNMVLLSNRPSRDMLSGEKGERMTALDLRTGKIVWDKKMTYNNPPILLDDSIVVDTCAYDLLTGEIKMRANPLTGENTPFTYNRTYGCNTVTAGKHLLLFRSAAAGFYDWDNLGGTGNFGGYKSSCTSNLIPACGVLNSPDYTRTCSCSYQNQTSLAFINMPELEYWTNNQIKWDGSRINNFGLNFGAPGDRMYNGTLWLEYPLIGGASPKLQIKVNGNYQRNTKHSLLMKGDQNWVGASSISNFDSIEITINKNDNEDAKYDLLLYFAESDRKVEKGDRIFNLEIADKKIGPIDIISIAGEALKTVSIPVKMVKIDKKITIKAIPMRGTALLSGIHLKRIK